MHDWSQITNTKATGFWTQCQQNIMYLIQERITDLKTAIILLSMPFTFWSASQLCLNLLINGAYNWYSTSNMFLHTQTTKWFNIEMIYAFYYSHVQKIPSNVTSTNKHTFTSKQHRLSPMKSLHLSFAVLHQLQVFFILSVQKSTTDKLFAKSESSCIKINRPKLQPTYHTKKAQPQFHIWCFA